MDVLESNDKEEKEEGEQKKETLWEMVSALSDIESVLGTSTERGEDKGNTIRLPLSTVMRVFPEEYIVKEEVANIKPEDTVAVAIPNLLEQLATGRVALSVADLAFFVPTNLLVPSAFKDHDTKVSLPLGEVVKAINVETLKGNLSSKTRQYTALHAIKDPFAELFQQQPVTSASGISEQVISSKEPSSVETMQSVEESVVEKKEEEVAASVLSEPVQEVIQPQAEISVSPTKAVEESVVEKKEEEVTASVSPVIERPPAEEAPPSEEVAEYEQLAGVEINSASVEQFMTLDGVERELAERIVAYRTEHGPFKSIFELCNVPRLSRRTFMLMTGMPYSEKRYHRRNKLASLLKISFAEAGNLKVIAEKISQGVGILGSVIADKDGFVLAEYNCGSEAEKLAAMVPRIVKQIRDSIILWKPVEVDAVSISVSGQLLTLLACNVVNVCIVHKTPHISRAQLMFFIKVGKELSWLLSYRAYLGRRQ